jgi:hypothetical protein
MVKGFKSLPQRFGAAGQIPIVQFQTHKYHTLFDLIFGASLIAKRLIPVIFSL